MAVEASEIKLEDEIWSSEPNENDFARTTASNCPPSEGSEFPLAEGEITVREGFIATPEQLVQEQFTVSVELPEPAVGAEVDCEARSFKSEENAINTPACNTRSPAPGRGGRRRTMRPEDKNCSGCKIHFERHGRSFNRRAVYTFTTPETVHWAFPDATVHEKSFLCETCAQFIRSKCKRKQSGKRCLWLKPVASKQVRVRAWCHWAPSKTHACIKTLLWALHTTTTSSDTLRLSDSHKCHISLIFLDHLDKVTVWKLLWTFFDIMWAFPSF